MKHHPLIFLLLVSFLSVNAQKAELLTGRWLYKDIADKEKLDSMTLKAAKLGLSNMELEFEAGGKYYYSSIAGTWKLSPDETKVLVTLVNPMTKQETTNEMAIKSLTEKELKATMNQVTVIFTKAPPKPKAPAKAMNINADVLAKCGTPAPEDVLIKLVSAVKSKNLSQVMNATCGFGVKGFTLSDKVDDKKGRNDRTGEEEDCICYISNEKVMNDSYGIRIYQFKSGDIKAICVLDAETNKALYQKCTAGSLMILEQADMWDYFGAGTDEALGVIIVPNGKRPNSDFTEWFLGGMCSIYSYSSKKN